MDHKLTLKIFEYQNSTISETLKSNLDFNEFYFGIK